MLDGLSEIPDALPLAPNRVLDHTKDRNYVILVSDAHHLAIAASKGKWPVR